MCERSLARGLALIDDRLDLLERLLWLILILAPCVGEDGVASWDFVGVWEVAKLGTIGAQQPHVSGQNVSANYGRTQTRRYDMLCPLSEYGIRLTITYSLSSKE